jgi:hypothetical protein
MGGFLTGVDEVGSQSEAPCILPNMRLSNESVIMLIEIESQNHLSKAAAKGKS